MWSERGMSAVRVAASARVSSFWDDAPVTAVEEGPATSHFVEAGPRATHPSGQSGQAAQPGHARQAAQPGQAGQARQAVPALPDESEGRPSFAELERDAFMKGYAQGERSGAEAAAKRSEATLRRLAQTVEDLAGLRTELVKKTEQQVVELSLAIAERILRREVAVDQELLVAMARVALERLGENISATIRLNPEDYAIIGAKAQLGDSSLVRVVADPQVSSGGCLVQSDFGLIDVGIEAQLGEMSAALGVAPPAAHNPARAARGAA